MEPHHGMSYKFYTFNFIDTQLDFSTKVMVNFFYQNEQLFTLRYKQKIFIKPKNCNNYWQHGKKHGYLQQLKYPKHVA